MKNQYVGDINDYRKYGLIRCLIDETKLGVGVFWMLTPDDYRNDGRRLNYLEQPDRWSKYDPTLFDLLKSVIHEHRRRDVPLVQELQVLSQASFVLDCLPDDTASRTKIFTSAFKSLSNCQILFFDPDNGLETASTPVGRKDSNKYLYFPELKEAFNKGHSLLIYQHFPREKREPYIARRVGELRRHTGVSTIFSFSTSYACFFLVPQEKHARLFQECLQVVSSRWSEELRPRCHLAE